MAETVVGSLMDMHSPLDMFSDWRRKDIGLCKLRNVCKGTARGD